MGEKVLLQGLCNRIKGAFVENGHGMLTDRRFIYSKHSFAKILLIGAFVNLTKGDYEFDIPISDIKCVKETNRLLNKILVIETRYGNEYKFYFTKRKEWKALFDNLINKDVFFAESDVSDALYCSKCGTKMEQNDTFCRKCGNRV